MRKVYICSPYRAKDGAELDRNIDYAQQLTRFLCSAHRRKGVCRHRRLNEKNVPGKFPGTFFILAIPSRFRYTDSYPGTIHLSL